MHMASINMTAVKPYIGENETSTVDAKSSTSGNMSYIRGRSFASLQSFLFKASLKFSIKKLKIVHLE